MYALLWIFNFSLGESQQIMEIIQQWLQNHQILLTITVIIGALVLFVVEWLPIDITAILVTVALMILGLVSP